VLLRDTSRMAVLEAESANKPLALRCSVATDAEPVALATTKDDGKVSSPPAGASRSASTRPRNSVVRRRSPAREPRAIAVADDDNAAYVTHAVGGAISVVDLGTREAKQVPLRGQDGRFGFRRSKKGGRAKPFATKRDLNPNANPNDPNAGRMSCQSFALAKSVAPGGRILAPLVFVDPGEATEQRTEGYGSADQATEMPGIAVLDEGTRAPSRRRSRSAPTRPCSATNGTRAITATSASCRAPRRPIRARARCSSRAQASTPSSPTTRRRARRRAARSAAG